MFIISSWICPHFAWCSLYVYTSPRLLYYQPYDQTSIEEANLQQDFIDGFCKLIKLRLDDNVCYFLNKIYKLQGELPMGAPLSALA